MSLPRSRYTELSRAELAVLVPEPLLIGQLIERSGMAWCIASFGREEMLQIAIEEWAGASPIYTKRIQKALGYEGDDVITIFKGCSSTSAHRRKPWISATPSTTAGTASSTSTTAVLCSMSNRWAPTTSGGMCHDIEAPTFEATAVATNPRAQVRPIHCPPRQPADRHRRPAPDCHRYGLRHRIDRRIHRRRHRRDELPEVLVTKVSRGAAF